MSSKLLLPVSSVAVILLAVVYVLYLRLRAVASERDDYAADVKAYSAALSDATGGERVLRLRVTELEASGDAQLRAMDSLRREIGVRDRRLRSMHRRVTVVERADTVLVPDTVVTASLDTVVDDGWVRTSVSLAPGRVAVSSLVRNETTLIVSTRRETVRPPRRFPLFRLFQRRHTVVTVKAVEANPWCATREARSVEIVQ